MPSGHGHDTFEHTADMGLRGWGEDLEASFREAALALFSLMVDAGELKPEMSTSIRVDGGSLEELLVEFLNELISSAHLKEAVFIDLSIDDLVLQGGRWKLSATSSGILTEHHAERLLSEVKAATYHEASVTEDRSGMWTVQCVVDL